MRAHGTRACYVFGPEPGSDRSKGCRCEPCMKANRDYSRARYRAAHRPDEEAVPAYVDAYPARVHLEWLASVGVGTRTISERSRLSRTNLVEIKLGRQRRCTAETLDRVLAVGKSSIRGSTLLPAGPTWKLLNDLIRHGYTKTEIARLLGSKAKTPALQIDREFVTATNAEKVRALHERLLFRVIRDREINREAVARSRARRAEEAIVS